MVSRPFRCDESRLKSFLNADLPELEHLELAGHLDTCAACRRTLERLAAGSRLWADLRHLANGPLAPIRPEDSETGIFTGARVAGGSTGETHQLSFLSPSELPGSLGRLGSYEVTELLGRGGFGVVLKANDRALGRTVAIKVLAPQLATSAAARTRFAREAKAAAAVVHEHVVAIHAVDAWNGLPYLVMHYVAGRSLQERVDREGPLGVKEVLRIGMQTAQGLAAAHAQGLVHRDVKPSNILLENGVERVQLTDFGLARAIDDASLTQSGVVAGTPQYMSPEQAQGEAIDHRSDLFSLGSVLYFVCAGHSPFRANSTPAVLRRVCDERPRPLREVNPEVPVWLADIIARLHSKDPAGRFQTAAEVAELLGRNLAELQRGKPVTPPSPVPKPSHHGRRFGRKTAAALIVCVPLVALAVTATNEPNPFWGAILPAMRYPHGPQNGFAGNDAIHVVQEGVAEDSIVGSGKPAGKTWDLSEFDRVQIRSTFRAEVTKGDGFKVATTADDNVLPHVQVVKEGTTLKIGLEPHRRYSLKTELKAEITLPRLVGLNLSGASATTLKGFQSEKELTLELSGASKLDGELAVETANFRASGASTLSLTGSARAAQLSASGASHLKLAGLPLKRCELQLEGASTASLSVRSEAAFKAALGGASHLKGSVSATDIELDLQGASQATLGGSSGNAKLSLTDASHLKMPEFSLNANTLLVTVEGASFVTLQGKAENAVLKGSGASHLDLAGVDAKTAEVKLSAASSATVGVREKLTYELSSVSHLNYVGDPASLSGKKSGGSTISRQH
jgi:serine/threonine-protein kinase